MGHIVESRRTLPKAHSCGSRDGDRAASLHQEKTENLSTDIERTTRACHVFFCIFVWKSSMQYEPHALNFCGIMSTAAQRVFVVQGLAGLLGVWCISEEVTTPGVASAAMSLAFQPASCLRIYGDALVRQRITPRRPPSNVQNFMLPASTVARLYMRAKKTPKPVGEQGHPVGSNGMSQSEMMKARWKDTEWRAAMLAKRRTAESVKRRSEAARKMWLDPSFRRKMRESRIGKAAPPVSSLPGVFLRDYRHRRGNSLTFSRVRFETGVFAGRRAWNLGKSASPVTRLRMSVARKGVKKSEVCL